MDGKSGWYFAHKVGDLVRIRKLSQIDVLNKAGDIGIVTSVPRRPESALFVEVFMFRTNSKRWLQPSEFDIISNIDEQLSIYLEGSRYEADQQFCRGDVTNVRLDKLWSFCFCFVLEYATTTIASTI